LKAKELKEVREYVCLINYMSFQNEEKREATEDKKIDAVSMRDEKETEIQRKDLKQKIQELERDIEKFEEENFLLAEKCKLEKKRLNFSRHSRNSKSCSQSI
jgi:hypothetical protein